MVPSSPVGCGRGPLQLKFMPSVFSFAVSRSISACEGPIISINAADFRYGSTMESVSADSETHFQSVSPSFLNPTWGNGLVSSCAYN